MSARWLTAGTRLVLAGKAGALVTGPVAKASVALAVPGFRGQTEFVARLAGVREPVMMMAGPRIRAVVGTRHVGLRAMPRLVTGAMLDNAISVTARGLRRWFGIPRPRLAVCGLNPHAGESGLLGPEDERVIRPAVRRALRRGITASGPHPADSVFAAAMKGRYDAVIGMYHDQASIPAKTVDGPFSVNVTLGLPFLRTSPAHGTAFDIAGRRRADPTSMLAALEMALKAASHGS
jgi:4-hydroxythreonine-4-phosphate dehydrogenase